MIITCSICEREFDIPIDEYIEADGDEYVCPDCADAIIEHIGDWFNEWELRRN